MELTYLSSQSPVLLAFMSGHCRDPNGVILCYQTNEAATYVANLLRNLLRLCYHGNQGTAGAARVVKE